MSHRSRFFNAMACFLTTDQNGKTPKKRAHPAPKNKSKRNHDILISDPIPQAPSKPKRHLQINTAKPKNPKEVVDLTKDEDDLAPPIKIQILDETLNMAPILFHIKIDPCENTNVLNSSQYSINETYIKAENTSHDDGGIVLSNDEITIDDSATILDNMSIKQQNDPFKNDVPIIKQSYRDNVDLSRDENKDTSCRMDNQTGEMEELSSQMENEDNFKEKKHNIDEKPTACNSGRKNIRKTKIRKQTIEQFHSSKIALNGSGSYFCFLCEATIKEKKAIAQHILNHKQLKPGYKCSVCEERFQWKGLLSRHLKQHFDHNGLEPNIESDQTTDDLAHKIASKPVVSKLYKTAEDVYETFNDLEQKLKSNSNSTHSSLIKLISDTDRSVMNIACGYCDECFNSQLSLVEHCRTHMTDRPFMCNICGTLFKQNSALIFHTRVHFQMIRNRRKKISAPFIKYILKLHSCNECDRSYVSWSALNQHIVNAHSATAERFICKACDRVFYNKTSLRNHKNQTSCKFHARNKKKFICDVCEISCCNKAVLQRHKLRKHESA